MSQPVLFSATDGLPVDRRGLMSPGVYVLCKWLGLVGSDSNSQQGYVERCLIALWGRTRGLGPEDN